MLSDANPIQSRVGAQILFVILTAVNGQKKSLFSHFKVVPLKTYDCNGR